MTHNEQLAARLGSALAARGEVLACAESCTGGGVAQAITAIAGSSAWFDRGFVTYSNAAKTDMLGVSTHTLELHGAVSEATARAMAQGAIAHSLADWSLAITGIAGPGGGTVEKTVGMVCFAWDSRDGGCLARTCQLGGSREEIRQQAIGIALQGLLDCLQTLDVIV